MVDHRDAHHPGLPPARSCRRIGFRGGQSWARAPASPDSQWASRPSEARRTRISKCCGEPVSPNQRRRHNGDVLATPAMPRSARPTSRPPPPTRCRCTECEDGQCPSSDRTCGIRPAFHSGGWLSLRWRGDFIITICRSSESIRPLFPDRIRPIHAGYPG